MTMNRDVDTDAGSRRHRGSADFLLVIFAMITGGGLVFLLTAFGVIPHLEFGDNSVMIIAVVVGIVLAAVGWMRLFRATH